MRTLEEIRQKNKRKDLLLNGMESVPKKNIFKRIHYYFLRKQLKRFVKHNKEKIYKLAEENTKSDVNKLLETKNHTVISLVEEVLPLQDTKLISWSKDEEKDIINSIINNKILSPKCHLCGVPVKDVDGEICDGCLTEVNKRLFIENEKLNEKEYKKSEDKINENKDNRTNS